MKIKLLQKELELSGRKITSEVKNGDELYVITTPDDIRSIFGFLITDIKLNFVTEFCLEKDGFVINVVLSNRKDGYFVVLSYKSNGQLISLQDLTNQAHLFEREIADLFGIEISGGRDVRNIVKHEGWPSKVFPLRKAFPHGEKIFEKREVDVYKFKGLSGEGGFQIPVGPVHAGIIEPGHFRFSVMGEKIENLEIRLMYKHRGIEKLCENIDAEDLNLIFERVAGESSTAYSEAYALLIEKLTTCEIPEEIKALRVVLLELERIYNYLDDISGICVDVGFSYPAKKFGYFSELIHQLCERLTGSRYLRNSIIPCGTNINFTMNNKKDILDTLNSIKKRLYNVIDATLENVSFLDRVESTGIVFSDNAKKLAMTGVVGRACGISYDVRHSFPYEIYKLIKKKVNLETVGGVFERYKLKIEEMKDAFFFIEEALNMINSDIVRTRNKIILKEGFEAIAAVETVKGELVVYGQTGGNNKFNRIYFKTPSFTNWDGLTYAVLNEIVPDFPLCNKSFNMSYSENDR